VVNVASGSLLPRANPAACPQLAKADFASSSQHVREGQRIAELEAEFDNPAAGGRCAGRGTADIAPWVSLRVKVAACRERAHALFSWTNVRIRRKETRGR
jgi:hypothetical protein